jgi:hypothetical protein
MKSSSSGLAPNMAAFSYPAASSRYTAFPILRDKPNRKENARIRARRRIMLSLHFRIAILSLRASATRLTVQSDGVVVLNAIVELRVDHWFGLLRTRME